MTPEQLLLAPILQTGAVGAMLVLSVVALYRTNARFIEFLQSQHQSDNARWVLFQAHEEKERELLDRMTQKLERIDEKVRTL